MWKTIRAILTACFITVISITAMAQNSPISFGRQPATANQSTTSAGLTRSGNTSTAINFGSTVAGVDFQANPANNVLRSGTRSANNGNIFSANPAFSVNSSSLSGARSSTVSFTPPPVQSVATAASTATPATAPTTPVGTIGTSGQPTTQDANGQSASAAPLSCQPAPVNITLSCPASGDQTASRSAPRVIVTAPAADPELRQAQLDAARSTTNKNTADTAGGLSYLGPCNDVNCQKAQNSLTPAELLSIVADGQERQAKDVPMSPKQQAVYDMATTNAIYNGARDFASPFLNAGNMLKGLFKGGGQSPSSSPGTTPITPTPNRSTPSGNQSPPIQFTGPPLLPAPGP